MPLLLVALVVFLFLGDWRSTLIPILAVPVSLIGAFFVIQLFGLSINLVTLFALVLAIGIVVDDAIVVVEAVHAKMEEEPHLTPFNAVKKVLGEISGAIIAITLVMVSVFLPISFMSGPVGTFYRQFSITMASSIVISALIALTLTPVLCAMLLKNHHGHAKKKNLLTKGLDSFNRGFDKLTGRYVGLLRLIVNRQSRYVRYPAGVRAGHILREYHPARRLYSQRRPGYHLRHYPDPSGLYAGENQPGFAAASENLRKN